jgi:hypothetical protein
MAMICANRSRVEPIREGHMVAIVCGMPALMMTIRVTGMEEMREIIGRVGVTDMIEMIEIGVLGLMLLMSRKACQLRQQHLLPPTLHGRTGTLGTKMECPSAPSVACEVM